MREIRLKRRGFLKGMGMLMGAIWRTPSVLGADEGRKLRVGVVGVGNRGAVDIDDLMATGLVEIVALCDVDETTLKLAGERWPAARTYGDYRKMLGQKDVEAVVVATADHMHAWVTLAALRSGRHVYCEKPLAHSVEEARVVARVARQSGCVTQLGIQMHDEENYRRVVELIRGGAIGRVSDVHVFVDTAWFGEKPAETGVKTPAGLDWDLWVGATAGSRMYSPDYLPVVWRRWWAFGEGTLGDMGCHYMDLPNWALELGPPARVRARGPEVNGEWCPAWMEVEYEFPARGKWPAVKLTWHDAGRRPGILAELKLHDWTSGILFVGEKGQLVTNYTRHALLLAEQFKGFRPPGRTMASSIGHHKEWVMGCLKNDPMLPACSFAYGGPLTETVLLGCVAYRTGQEIKWDSERMEALGTPGAERLIRLKYREGWAL